VKEHRCSTPNLHDGFPESIVINKVIDKTMCSALFAFLFKGRHRLYVFSYKSDTECSSFRSADSHRLSPGRSANLDSSTAGGDAKNFAED
jgi:hypothetical protein